MAQNQVHITPHGFHMMRGPTLNTSCYKLSFYYSVGKDPHLFQSWPFLTEYVACFLSRDLYVSTSSKFRQPLFSWTLLGVS